MGNYMKDLSAISSDLSSIFIVDNSPGAYRGYPGMLLRIDLYWILNDGRLSASFTNTL